MAIHISQISLARLLSKCLHNTLPISSFYFSTFTPTKQTVTPTNTKTRTKTFSHIFQECTHHQSLNPGKQAHARIIVSGFTPTIFVTNCLIQMYIKCFNLENAYRVFDNMPQTDVVSWNALVFGYASSGNVGFARSLFEAMPERDVVSWNSLMSGYLQTEDCFKLIEVFVEMAGSDVGFDQRSFAVVLKACSVLENCDLGVQVHGFAMKLGFNRDVVTGSALVDMYAKCKKLDSSLLLFSEISEKNWVSWSAMVAGCVQNYEFVKGLELFKEMLKNGVEISQSIYASVFRSCAGLSAFRFGTQLHAHALKTGFESDIIVGTATLDMYSKCNNMSDAKKLFNTLPNHSLQCYNAIIVGYARSGRGFEGLQLFQRMLTSGLGFNEISLSGAFSACAVIQGYLEGLQVHGLAVKSTFSSNICVANAIVDMYGKCGALIEACRIFDEMERRDAVSWNAIIAAHEQNGNEKETLSSFVSMLRATMEPDEFTYGSVLKACAGQQALGYGMEIHTRIIKSRMEFNSFVRSALVHMYCKCGMMEEAQKIHDRTKERYMVSWNAIISGFSEQKQSENAQRYFSWMLELGVQPDSFTYATVLDTCGNLAIIGLGKQIHAQIIKQELLSDVYITSTLVDMYSKCGNMIDSKIVFEKAPKRDFVTWNAMICGYAQHGLGVEALKIFEHMQSENIKPNHATFISVLRACAHMGLIEKGFYYFKSMLNDYGLDPQLEHYSCMVDLLGRSGQFSEALKLIQQMPFEADDVIWRTLLSICCDIHGNIEVAEIAATALFQLDPQDSTSFILLSNIYAEAGMWNKVSDIRRMMKQNKLKKEPGCSWIEIKDEIHAFLVGDKAHPEYKEIYDKLGLLLGEMKGVGCVPDIDFLLYDEAEERF
ncbi:hypothetical protein EZV62_015718 [Acer yangbiense]|uniref:Uncharacterized protein n=1 Tax=Acer yangbiense TaxID=1000413 RepID=A0A5C7HM76_9ROSI|nr:hypothetical protein EZV62_015718 [Acer yangbiense]